MTNRQIILLTITITSITVFTTCILCNYNSPIGFITATVILLMVIYYLDKFEEWQKRNRRN